MILREGVRLLIWLTASPRGKVLNQMYLIAGIKYIIWLVCSFAESPISYGLKQLQMNGVLISEIGLSSHAADAFGYEMFCSTTHWILSITNSQLYKLFSTISPRIFQNV